MHHNCLTPSELIEISLIGCFPIAYQTATLKTLLDQCDRQHRKNPNYSRQTLETLPTAQAIYQAQKLLNHATTTK